MFLLSCPPFWFILSEPCIPIRVASRREDHICWISSSKGDLDSKNAYMLATGLNPNDPKFAGNWVWKLKILPKIQLFVWKCLLKSIPTKSILALRGFGGGTSCDWCHEIKRPLLMSLEIARLQPVFGQRRIVLLNSNVPLMVRFLNG